MISFPNKRYPSKDLHTVYWRTHTHGDSISSSTGATRARYIDIPLGQELRETLQFLSIHSQTWLSHNGVAIPARSLDIKIEDVFMGEPTWAKGIIALADSLRPDLSLSREALLGFPWSVYSTLGLALYRALSATGIDLSSQAWHILGKSMLLRKPLLLRDLMEDELLRLDGSWSGFPIIQTKDGLRSFQEIRHSADRYPIELFNLPPQGGEKSYLSWCAATLAQVGLKVYCEFSRRAYNWDRGIRIFAFADSAEPITESHKLFPPLTFLPFRNSEALRSSSAPVVNTDHPFGVWLLKAAPELAKRYPNLFERMRSDLLLRSFEQKVLRRLNAALHRLRELHPSVRPPENLVLAPEDIFDQP